MLLHAQTDPGLQLRRGSRHPIVRRAAASLRGAAAAVGHPGTAAAGVAAAATAARRSTAAAGRTAAAAGRGAAAACDAASAGIGHPGTAAADQQVLQRHGGECGRRLRVPRRHAAAEPQMRPDCDRTPRRAAAARVPAGHIRQAAPLPACDRVAKADSPARSRNAAAAPMPAGHDRETAALQVAAATRAARAPSGSGLPEWNDRRVPELQVSTENHRPELRADRELTESLGRRADPPDFPPFSTQGLTQAYGGPPTVAGETASHSTDWC